MRRREGGKRKLVEAFNDLGGDRLVVHGTRCGCRSANLHIDGLTDRNYFCVVGENDKYLQPKRKKRSSLEAKVVYINGIPSLDDEKKLKEQYEMECTSEKDTKRPVRIAWCLLEQDHRNGAAIVLDKISELETLVQKFNDRLKEIALMQDRENHKQEIPDSTDNFELHGDNDNDNDREVVVENNQNDDKFAPVSQNDRNEIPNVLADAAKRLLVLPLNVIPWNHTGWHRKKALHQFLEHKLGLLPIGEIEDLEDTQELKTVRKWKVDHKLNTVIANGNGLYSDNSDLGILCIVQEWRDFNTARDKLTITLKIDIPGGKRELGETSLMAACRETWEETLGVVDLSAYQQQRTKFFFANLSLPEDMEWFVYCGKDSIRQSQ